MTHELKSGDAAVSGVAARISAADKAAMVLQAQPAVLRATIHITRAATGKVETYDLVGTADTHPETDSKEP